MVMLPDNFVLGALANGEAHTTLQPPGFPTIAYPGIGRLVFFANSVHGLYLKMALTCL